MHEPCRATQRFILSVSNPQGKFFADHDFFSHGSISKRRKSWRSDQDRHRPQIRTAGLAEQVIPSELREYPAAGETGANRQVTRCAALQLPSRLLSLVSVLSPLCNKIDELPQHVVQLSSQSARSNWQWIQGRWIQGRWILQRWILEDPPPLCRWGSPNDNQGGDDEFPTKAESGRSSMGRFFIAMKAFFRVLGGGIGADQIDAVLRGEPARLAAPPESATIPGSPKTVKPSSSKPEPARPARSDAVTLLATLQREARLIDLVQESLDGYSDAQVGAAARDVLRNCRKVLDQSFAIQPIRSEPEGTPVDVAQGYDPGVYRLTGNVSGDGPFRGSVVHHGWKIGHCQLPTWTGSREAAEVVAAVEVEIS